MKKLYEKSKLWFALTWIIIYVVGTSLVDGLTQTHGATFGWHLAMMLVILAFLKQQGLFREYGLCRPNAKAGKFLYYIPLAVISTVNFWFGVKLDMPVHEAMFYAGSMLCVGFLEEIIFRGFLFKAMAKDNITSAIIVSSLTFGIGHLVNLVNGSGMDLVSNLCQVVYAVAFGYMCVILFHHGGSLLPCIAVHSIVNASSVFEGGKGNSWELVIAAILTVVPLAYALILRKTLPEKVS